jgi:hypothetical protein
MLQHGGRPGQLSTLQPDISNHDEPDTGRVSGLEREVRRARLAQAAHFDAVVAIRDAQTLRLAALNDELVRKMREEPRLAALLPLQIDPGFPPRLWLDDISYVEMEPDPRTFRLVRQDLSGHVTVAETRELREIVSRIRSYASHRLIESERIAGGRTNGNGRGLSQLIMVWLAGFTFGVLALLAAGAMLGKIGF